MRLTKEQLANLMSENDSLKIDNLNALNATPQAIEPPSRRITLTIDHLPNRDLSPNARRHWAAKAKDTEAAKGEMHYLAKFVGANWQAPEHATISYVFTVTTHRNRDLDNLIASCKAWQDGLVQVGILKADDCWHLSLGRVQVVKGESEQTLIEISEI